MASVKNVLLLAEMAKENHQYQLAYWLVRDVKNFYKQENNIKYLAFMEIELLWQNLNRPNEAKKRIQALMVSSDQSFRQDLIKLEQMMP